jgi:predicted RNA-binding Zn ribbon-like protein
MTWSADGLGVVWRSRHPGTIADALAAIARAAIHVVSGPAAALIHRCGAPGCIRIFFRDHGRRVWCSDGCGGRVRAARHYQAHKGG